MVQALQRLLETNADPSDTRWRILSDADAAELTEDLVEWQNAQHAIACMQETYRRRHPEAEVELPGVRW